jgi:hypothetical protein
MTINDEVRTIVSQSHAGGALSSAHSVTGGGGPGTRGSSDAWPVDLRELDEGLETSLGDPSESGSLYIRLLVKTIGVLECEEDVERMVLDGVVDKFRESVVHQVREHAAAKLAKELHREHRHSVGGATSPSAGLDEDDVLAVHRRLYTSFVGSLLDGTLMTLRRMLYLLKLLYVSKTMRSSEGGYGAALSSAHVDVDRAFKEHNKRQVLSAWMGIEDLVIQQMLSHLVEPDVAGITDSGTGRAEGLISKYGSQNRDGFLLLEKGDHDVHEDGDVELIFTPSARHAAPIFRRVVSYAHLTGKILRENALEESKTILQASRPHLSPLAGSPVKSGSASSVSSPGQSNGILEVIQSFLESELIPVIQSTVNHGMREIQMNNAHFSVRFNSATLPQLVDAADEGAEEEAAVPGTAAVKSPSPQKRAVSDAVPLCYAAQLCVSAAKPLFSYWLQLHQHRSMVSTVLDRLIRGFASAAREELEGLTYSCVTMTLENVHSQLMQATKLDPLYKAYRIKMFGPNKASVDDLFGSAAAIPGGPDPKNLARRSFMPSAGVGGGAPSRRPQRGSHAHSTLSSVAEQGGGEQEEGRGRNALEATVWDQLDYFDVGNHNYPVTSQKVCAGCTSVLVFFVHRVSGSCMYCIDREGLPRCEHDRVDILLVRLAHQAPQ